MAGLFCDGGGVGFHNGTVFNIQISILNLTIVENLLYIENSKLLVFIKVTVCLLAAHSAFGRLGGLQAVLLLESGSRIHLTEFEWPKNPAPSGYGDYSSTDGCLKV